MMFVKCWRLPRTANGTQKQPTSEPHSCKMVQIGRPLPPVLIPIIFAVMFRSQEEVLQHWHLYCCEDTSVAKKKKK